MDTIEKEAIASKLKSELSPEELGRFILSLGLGNECDNYGQVVLYTGLKHGKDGQYEVMTDEDFQEKEEEEDLWPGDKGFTASQP